ncbi:MAG: hypothetical protein IJK33_00675 [Clostridia bacterium]|nr:hypothetical protein [Clostridia bacterium]
MIFILSAVIGLIAFAAELIFGRILKQGGKDAALGISYIRSVLYPVISVSAALWGSLYLERDGDLILQLLVCAGFALVFFLLEFFAFKKRVSAFVVFAILLQSAAAIYAVRFFGERTGTVLNAIAFGTAALLPAAANTALYSLKSKVRATGSGILLYLLADLCAPVIACLTLIFLMSEVFVNAAAL